MVPKAEEWDYRSVLDRPLMGVTIVAVLFLCISLFLASLGFIFYCQRRWRRQYLNGAALTKGQRLKLDQDSDVYFENLDAISMMDSNDNSLEIDYSEKNFQNNRFFDQQKADKELLNTIVVNYAAIKIVSLLNSPQLNHISEIKTAQLRCPKHASLSKEKISKETFNSNSTNKTEAYR